MNHTHVPANWLQYVSASDEKRKQLTRLAMSAPELLSALEELLEATSALTISNSSQEAITGIYDAEIRGWEIINKIRGSNEHV